MKKSKYEMMISSIVSMSFADVEVTGYKSRKPEGKKYYKREIEIDNLLWVSVQSFEKQSFSKRYFKAIEESKKVVKEEEPVKYEIRAMSDIYCWRGDRSTEVERAINDMANIDDINELKKYWRTECCKKFHPDHGGNAEDFAEVRFWYEEELRNIESIQTALDEILNESVVEPVDELHDLKTTYNLKDLKNAYRTLARRYHPDNLDTGDSDRFKLAKTIYDVRKLIIEEISEVFGHDDNFEELVDMTEDLHKSLHKIVY